MKVWREYLALLQMGLSGIGQRLGSSAVTVIGVACVVGVLVSMLSMGAGVQDMAMRHVRADRAEVLSQGAQSDNNSNLSKETVAAVRDMPGIKHDTDGHPIATAQSSVFTRTRRKSDNAWVAAKVTGVDAQYFKVYPELHLTSGRLFKPGLRELIVGRLKYEQDKGMEIGDRVRFHGGDWTIVGQFDADRNLNLNMLTDADTLMSAIGRNSFNAMDLLLETPASFATLQAAIKADPAVDVELKHEEELMRAVTKQLGGILNFVSYFVGVIMAVGATLGAINALYAAVDSRRREIATLRALGFGNFPIVLAVLSEALLLALPGALLGVVAAWLFFNGNTINPVGLSIRLTVTPALVVVGLTWAALMGLMGGLWPALRATRVPVTAALRAN